MFFNILGCFFLRLNTEWLRDCTCCMKAYCLLHFLSLICFTNCVPATHIIRNNFLELLQFRAVLTSPQSVASSFLALYHFVHTCCSVVCLLCFVLFLCLFFPKVLGFLPPFSLVSCNFALLFHAFLSGIFSFEPEALWTPKYFTPPSCQKLGPILSFLSAPQASALPHFSFFFPEVSVASLTL